MIRYGNGDRLPAKAYAATVIVDVLRDLQAHVQRSERSVRDGLLEYFGRDEEFEAMTERELTHVIKEFDYAIDALVGDKILSSSRID